jgi:hypothetical protein
VDELGGPVPQDVHHGEHQAHQGHNLNTFPSMSYPKIYGSLTVIFPIYSFFAQSLSNGIKAILIWPDGSFKNLKAYGEYGNCRFFGQLIHISCIKIESFPQ